MFLDVPDATFLIAQPFGRIVPTQLLDELFGSAGDISGEVDGVDAFENDVVSLHGVGASKRRSARQ